MNKILALLSVFVLISCGSSKKVTSDKKSKATDFTEKNERKVVPSKEAINEVENIINENKHFYKGTTLVYIKQYAPIAMDEMKNFNIPASITLAQGILESGSGQSNLANKSNNHFGIKCHTGWKGEKVYHDDDEKGECFRKYKYPATSYRDHSLFLTTRFRYASLFALDKDDYKGWAKGLKKAGYATDPKYSEKLISYIEKYELYKYDELVLKGKNIEFVSVSNDKAVSEFTNTQKVSEEGKYKGSKNIHVVKNGETLYSISKTYGVSVDLIKTNNNLHNNTIYVGDRLKLNVDTTTLDSNPLSDKKDIHVVRSGETLYSISKKYGISVNALKSKNNLVDNIIHVNDRLWVTNRAKNVNITLYHTVAKKETLYSISKKYNLTVEELKQKNNLTNNNLFIGQELRVN